MLSQRLRNAVRIAGKPQYQNRTCRRPSPRDAVESHGRQPRRNKGRSSRACHRRPARRTCRRVFRSSARRLTIRRAAMKRLWRPVFVDVWDAQWFQSLSSVGRLLYFYATSGPHTNRCGLCRFSIAEAADRLNAEPQETRSQFDTISRVLGWGYDGGRRVLWIPSWWNDNPHFCSNESAVRGAVKDLIGVPRSDLLVRFYENGVPTPRVDLGRFHNILTDTLGDWDYENAEQLSDSGVPHPVQHLVGHRVDERDCDPATVQHEVIQETEEEPVAAVHGSAGAKRQRMTSLRAIAGNDQIQQGLARLRRKAGRFGDD